MICDSLRHHHKIDRVWHQAPLFVQLIQGYYFGEYTLSVNRLTALCQGPSFARIEGQTGIDQTRAPVPPYDPDIECQRMEVCVILSKETLPAWHRQRAYTDSLEFVNCHRIAS